MAKNTVRFALLASLIAVAASGCTNARHEGSGTNDGMKTSNYRPFNYGTGNTKDMRLGLDRYRGTDPDLIKDNDSMRHGLNRDNGITGFDQDGVNRWSDYKHRDGTTGYGAGIPGTMTGTPGTTGPTGPTGTNMHTNTRMEAAQDIANHLTAVDPAVKSCNVLLTDNNAYVAVSTKSGQDLDNAGDVKTKIAEQVKAQRPNIQNVYVSANPDFVGRVTNYTHDLNAGKPVSGFIAEFNTMVQRLFPANAANPK
ncbi:YhcN/YlaJ family sporulation lipoprotein [Paenibacillus mesophilus]|uniref:YhcN/YlaJ family sporulation lipoprotein n=1 Tax=Paenibacillus mesophilus TaxID=2582849 RepID=UPI00110E75CE|nr:YhcN/YlaJ family sporulation lipoprotein [Paenibacillus mesophilus]TMV52976.1 YhcN/YlaJ family sporulation lipoprotein [Paenibacillus mesophilus]